MIEEVDVRVEVVCTDGASFYADPDEWDRLDAEWTSYIDGGKTRDKIIEAKTPNGSEIRFLVSRMVCLDRTTRESRRRARERSLYFDREAREDGIIGN